MLQWRMQSDAMPRGGANRIRVRLSSDWGLQPDPMKLDSLVIAHQPWRGEYVPGPCTHRPSHHESRLHPKSGICPPKVWVVIGMKS